MSTNERIVPGQRVVSSDGVTLGAVERFDGAVLHIDGWAIPAAAVARVEHGAVYLHLARADFAAGGDDGLRADPAARAVPLVIPLAEERLAVVVREVALGEVAIRTRVVTETRQVPVIARREELAIFRRAPDQPWGPDAAPGPGDAVTDVPLRGWEPVVAARAVVAREVVIERTRVAEAGHVAGTVRREGVAVIARHHAGAAGEGAPPPALVRHRASDAAGWEALRQQVRAVAPTDDEGDVGAGAPAERLVLPLAEERVAVGGHETDLGEVRVVRRAIEEPRTVALTVRRMVVEVVRRGPDGREVVEVLRRAPADQTGDRPEHERRNTKE